MKRLLAAALALVGMNLHAEPLAVGAPAPKITALNQDGQSIDLGSIYAKGLVLVYFYPKAGTPGCTAQACSLRDGISDLKGLGITVIGVSHDSVAAQKAFQQKYNLPFTLIADADGKVITAFGVPTLPGGMAMRQSFLVKDGKIVWYCPKADPKTHAKQVEDAIAGLKGK